MSDVAGILRHDGPDGPQKKAAVDYEPVSNKNIFGGPNYDFSDMYKTSAQAAADGDPTDRGKLGKKKLTKSGPTISISPISNLPLCDYGDWAATFDRENDPAATKPKPPPRKTFANPSLEELRKQLKNKGSNGLISLQKKFKETDDGNGHLTKEEFKSCMLSCSLMLTDSELTTLFNLFDKDKSGTVCSEEFILTLRGEMSDKRRELVYLAFQVLDSDGSGIVSLDEMARKYDCSQHPDVLTGKKSPSDVLLELMEVFEVGSTEEDKKAEISFEEFENYYSNISASIPSDKYFELMIRNAWHISGGEGEAQNSSNLRVLITRSDGKQEVVELKNDLGLKKKTDPGYMADLERRLRAQGLRDFKIGAVGSSDSGGVKKSEKNSTPRPNFQQNAQVPSSTLGAKDMGAKARIAAMAALEKLKQSLVQRGATGIIGLQRRFKIMDDDRSGQINREEFIKGMRECGLQIKDQEMGTLFNIFDKDQSGTISIDELLVAVRGEMTVRRKELVQMAFGILDTDHSGTIDAREVATKYDASQHPDVISGKKTKTTVEIKVARIYIS
jgi:calcyphosin